MTLKQQLTSEVAGIILDTVREKRGRLTEISDLCKINRSKFNVRGFSQLRVHQMLRIVYALAVILNYEDYRAMMTRIARAIEDFSDEYDYMLLDE